MIKFVFYKDYFDFSEEIENNLEIIVVIRYWFWKWKKDNDRNEIEVFFKLVYKYNIVFIRKCILNRFNFNWSLNLFL